jgi:hypothetical protein
MSVRSSDADAHQDQPAKGLAHAAWPAGDDQRAAILFLAFHRRRIIGQQPGTGASVTGAPASAAAGRGAIARHGDLFALCLQRAHELRLVGTDFIVELVDAPSRGDCTPRPFAVAVLDGPLGSNRWRNTLFGLPAMRLTRINARNSS